MLALLEHALEVVHDVLIILCDERDRVALELIRVMFGWVMARIRVRWIDEMDED